MILKTRSLLPLAAITGLTILMVAGFALLLASKPDPKTLLVGIPLFLLVVWIAGLYVEDLCFKSVLWISADEEVIWRTLTQTYSMQWCDLSSIAFVDDAAAESRIAHVLIVTRSGQEYHLRTHVDDWLPLQAIIQQRDDSLLVKKTILSLRRPVEFLVLSGFVLLLSAYVWYCKAAGTYEALFVEMRMTATQRIMFLYALPFALPSCGIALGIFSVRRVIKIQHMRKKSNQLMSETILSHTKSWHKNE